jgi:uncharacterized protein YjiS (DUF1127 family)
MIPQTTAPAPTLALPGPRDGWTWLGRLLAAVAQERQLRRDLRAVKALDDHLLRDIGLDRARLETSVRTGRP